MPATVLIVGNDKKTTATYSSFLKKDYGVVSAYSGRQALAQAKAHRIDALIIDTTSPRLNCKTLCRRLRGESAAPLILIASPTTRLDNSLSAA